MEQDLLITIRRLLEGLEGTVEELRIVQEATPSGLLYFLADRMAFALENITNIIKALLELLGKEVP